MVLVPEIAETMVGAPNMAAIPQVTPIIKPQETLPVKKPIPTEMMANAAKALPPVPVTILRAVHIVLTKALLFALPVTTQEQLMLQAAFMVVVLQFATAVPEHKPLAPFVPAVHAQLVPTVLAVNGMPSPTQSEAVSLVAQAATL